ncbi:MAG: DUF4390 domain-containing protein [Pseudomonadota bacterium]
MATIRTNLDARQLTGRHAWRASVALLSLLAIFLPGAAAADGSYKLFDVRSAFVHQVDGVYYLNARVDYTLTDGALRGLQNGVTMAMEVQLEVNHVRRFLPDNTVHTLRQRYELSYQPLSQRYLLRNLNSETQETFSTVDSAIRSMGVIDELPVLDAALLDADKRYEIRVRAQLDVRSVSGPIRLLLGWLADWRLKSDWYTWSLGP